MISVSLAIFTSGVHAIDVAGATYSGLLRPHPLSAAGELRRLDFVLVYLSPKTPKPQSSKLLCEILAFMCVLYSERGNLGMFN